MLKPFGQILAADPIWRGFPLYNCEAGTSRQRTLRNHYAGIESITLSQSVSETVREQFDAARNLFLYSWFVYAFIPIAQLHAFSPIEYAIRIKSGNPLMLRAGLELAIKEQWIKDGGFRYYDINVHQDMLGDDMPPVSSPAAKDIQSYCKILLDSLPDLRNELAHGNPMTYPGGLDVFAICADLINQLFELP
ncbi:MAG: hypothetical protein ABIU05_23480 [Nitrospirales bacterium]